MSCADHQRHKAVMRRSSEKLLAIFLIFALYLSMEFHNTRTTKHIEKLKTNPVNINLDKTLYYAENLHKCILFIAPRGDGIGARLSSISHGMALAFKYNMKLHVYPKTKFGQIYNPGDTDRALLENLLGYDVYDYREDPKIEMTFQRFTEMEKFFHNGKTTCSVYVKDDCLASSIDHFIKDSPGMKLDDYYTSKFLKQRRQNCHLCSSSSTKKTMAVHIRRGDIYKESKRWTPNEWYLKVIALVRKKLPDVEVHVYSSFGRYSRADFLDFEKEGYIVHIGEPIEDAWKAFTEANILVLAKSSFSHALAFFNDQCVIYQEFWHLPLESWMKTDSSLEFNEGDLEKCLKRIKQKLS